MTIFDIDSPEWMADAICATVDPETMFPEKGTSPNGAIALCRTCPVATQCLEYAVTAEASLFGVWGGTTERDRRPLRKARGTLPTERAKCRNNHAYTPENTGINSRGQRKCLTCARATDERHRAKEAEREGFVACAVCGGRVVRKGPGAKFCSATCHAAARNASANAPAQYRRKPKAGAA